MLYRILHDKVDVFLVILILQNSVYILVYPASEADPANPVKLFLYLKLPENLSS